MFVAGDQAAIQRAEEISMQYLFEARPALIEGVAEVWAKRVLIDQAGEAHTRVTQTIDNIPVLGAEAIVHLNPDGSFKSMTDGFIRHLEVNTTPKYRDYEAVDVAVDLVGGWGNVTSAPRAELFVLRHQGIDHLAYRVELMAIKDQEPTKPIMFFDAHTAELIWQYEGLETARNRRTYTTNNTTSLPGTLVRSETTGPSGDVVLDMAHDNAGLTYDFYFNSFGRDSFDGNGATLTSTVHYSTNYVNAFWNGSQMVYGDGNGVDSSPLVVTDVVAHELTHAVTDYASNLVYSYESGALNEAMSDIFGAAVEAYRDGAVSLNTFKVGEECWTPGTAGDALRYMYDPELGGDYDYYPTRYTGSSDNGGVHWNSGIANLAFYLMVQGGSHPRGKTTTVVTPLDAASSYSSLTKGAAIFYRANTVYLTANSQFADARQATVDAATDLYGASAAASVTAAWDAVGVLPPPDYQVLDTRTNLSGALGTETRYSYQTPSGATHIKFVISGGTGDADLYVKFGSEPTTTIFDCRPYKGGNEEVCEFIPAQAGTYHVMLRAYTSYSGVALTVSYAGGSQTPTEVCDDGADNDGDGSVDCADPDCASAPVCQAPATSQHVGDLDGSGGPSGKNWAATVSILVIDNNSSPVASATVNGSFSTGGTGSCVTGSDGRCSVTSSGISKRTASTTFSVSSVSHATLSYNAAANSDPDGDSDGSSIVVLKP